MSLKPNAIEEKSDQLLAEYAMRHSSSGGRLHAEAAQPYRTCYQRDRDRVIHSKAFRRLGYKTQVFVNSAGDNYRTRLTHSLEVGQVARSVAAVLALNVDYAETLALAHDLGHTPFGHAGQETLHGLMLHHGGFEHNRQSVRIVTALESRYLDFNGLNLSRSTIKGIMKHGEVYECDRALNDLCAERKRENPSLEAAIVDLCDRIAYNHHDLEDGLDSAFLSFDHLSEIEIWKDAAKEVEKRSGQSFRAARVPVQIRTIIRYMMNRCITDLIDTTDAKIQKSGIRTLDDALRCDLSLYPVTVSSEMNEILSLMQQFLRKNLYRHPEVMRMSRRGSQMIEFLFREYVENPEMMPFHVQNRITEHGLHRVVADYLSGMTDRYALEQYRYLTGS